MSGLTGRTAAKLVAVGSQLWAVPASPGTLNYADAAPHPVSATNSVFPMLHPERMPASWFNARAHIDFAALGLHIGAVSQCGSEGAFPWMPRRIIRIAFRLRPTPYSRVWRIEDCDTACINTFRCEPLKMQKLSNTSSFQSTRASFTTRTYTCATVGNEVIL